MSELEETIETETLSFANEKLYNLFTKFLEDGQSQITEEQQQLLLSLDKEELSGSQITTRFNSIMNTEYPTVEVELRKKRVELQRDWFDVENQLNGVTENPICQENITSVQASCGYGESKFTPISIESEDTENVYQSDTCVEDKSKSSCFDLSNQAITPETQEVIDIMLDDSEDELSDVCKQATRSLKLLKEEGIEVVIPQVKFVEESVQPDQEYAMVKKSDITRLVEENKQVNILTTKMCLEMNLDVKANTLSDRIMSIVDLFYNLKDGLSKVGKTVKDNKDLSNVNAQLNQDVAFYKQRVRELEQECEKIKIRNAEPKATSLDKPRYVIAFNRPAGDVAYLTESDGEFSPTNFGASLALFDAFKFSSEKQASQFLDMLIDSVGSHQIPEKYLANLQVKEIMLKSF